jgi:hypothetical protein
MAQPTETRSTPEKPEPSRKPFDGAANAQSFKDKWEALKATTGLGDLRVPGTVRYVSVSKVEALNNKVSIWISTDHTLPPDFVIVNLPTEVVNSEGELVDDPIAAVALVIDGASK